MTLPIDEGLIRGLMTLLVFGAFVGLVIWAYSSRRRADFDAAARLPLEGDSPQDDTDAAGDIPVTPQGNTQAKENNNG